MSGLATSSIVFAFMLAAALLGFLLRRILPEQHRSSESKEFVIRGMGHITTMAAVVLSLLIASAKNSYDAQTGEITQLAANVAFLPFPEGAARRMDHRRRTGVPLSDRQRRCSWLREVGGGSDGRRAQTGSRLDVRSPRQPRLVVCRRCRSPRHRQHVPPALRLLHDHDPHDLRPQHRIHLRLGGQAVDGADQPDSQPALEDRRAAGPVPARRALLCRAPSGRPGLGTPLHDHIPVPEVTATARHAERLFTLLPAPLDYVAGIQWLPPLSCIFFRTSSRLKLAAFCRCGYSLNVARNWPTKAWAGTNVYAWSMTQS